ncbi:MAG: glycosyltransferase family 4 protein [Egibacteraceae bacterium]
MGIQFISPRLLMEFTQAVEDIVIFVELGMVAFYAGLSRAFRQRKVVSLVEGDYQHLGRTGTAAFKVAFRRLNARFVDAFVANNELARNYLVHTLGVPECKIVVGWWLAGLPSDLKTQVPYNAKISPDGVPLFVCAGQLIPRKGVDLLIEAIARYRREFGPCMLWVLGDGPEKPSLMQLTRHLQVEDSVTFLGTVSHEGFKGALEACHVFVFPTLQDLVGRVVVEALTAGVPVVLSPMTGAAGTIVQDGVNGIIVDPRDSRALAEAMCRAADPETLRHLREGVQRTNVTLTPDASAKVILRAIALARGNAAFAKSDT